MCGKQRVGSLAAEMIENRPLRWLITPPR
jgi:hypothetical protein